MYDSDVRGAVCPHFHKIYEKIRIPVENLRICNSGKIQCFYSLFTYVWYNGRRAHRKACRRLLLHLQRRIIYYILIKYCLTIPIVGATARGAHKKACRRLLVNPPDKGTPLNPGSAAVLIIDARLTGKYRRTLHFERRGRVVCCKSGDRTDCQCRQWFRLAAAG